jgi:hypothetical protein
MARSVLKRERGAAAARRAAIYLTLALATLGCAGASVARGQAVVCSSEGSASIPDESQKHVQEVQQTVQAGVFYLELLHRFEKPESCRVKMDGTSVTLAYVFPHGARLEAQFDSAIEYSEQHLVLRGLNQDAALTLLKKGAADAFGDDGCGLDWSQSKDETDGVEHAMHSAVYRGTSCNCQARLMYRGKIVVGLALSSSC